MKTFEQRLKELEGINEKLKSADTPLQEALKLFEEGIGLAQGLEQELQEAERKVEILLKDESGEQKLQPFDDSSS